MRGVVGLLHLVAVGVVPVLAWTAIGLPLLRATGLAVRGAERIALAWVLGTGAASLGLLVLRALDVPVPLPALALLAAAGAWLLRFGGAGPGAPSTVPPPGQPGWVRVVDATSVVLAALLFTAALAPETAWDGFEYHLPMIRAWSEGPIRALPGMLDAELRAGADLLYLPAVAAGEPDAAAGVSACFAAALAALVRAESTRRASPGAGALAGLFVLLVPFSAENATNTYVDLAVGAYGFTALLAADRWNRGGERAALPVAALCLAFAANAKLHAAAIVPAVAVLLLAGGRVPPARRLAWCAGLVAALTLPWFAKAWLTTGNPLFPLFAGVLGAGPSTPELLALRQFRLGTDFPAPRDAGGLLQWVASVFYGRNPHVSGLVGPLPLALAPLAWHRPARPTLVLVATLGVLFALQFAVMPALRFGAPLLPFLAVAAAVGGARLARSGPLAQGVLAVALGLLAIHHAAALASRTVPRLAALRHPDAYERARFPDQVALREVVAGADAVVAIPAGAVAWMPQPVYNLLWERNGELHFDELRWNLHGERIRVARTPPGPALALLRARGVRSLVLDVRPPLPPDGTVGHPTVDAWIRAGRARRRLEPDPQPARGGRIWVVTDLVDP